MSNGNELDEIIDGFLIEAQEIFEDLSNGLVLFEQNPEDEELIKSIFRGFHTLKGTAGFLNFPNIEKSAHVMEDLLNQVRQGKRKISSQDIDTIFEGMDILQELLIKIQEDKTDDVDVTDFVNKLRIYLDDIPGEKPAPAKEEVKPTTKAKEKKAGKPKDRSKSEMIDVNITDDSAELVEPFLDDTKDSINRAKKIFDKGEEEEIINTVVQIIDTIKGSSGFIGFEPLEEVSIAFLKIQKGASLTLEPFKIEFDIFNKLVLEIIEDYQQKKKIKSSYKDYVKQADVVTETKEVKEAALKKKPVKEKTVPVEDGLVQGKVYELSEELSELVEVFYIELDEILDSLNQDFVELEKNPGDSELLNRIFRGAHTIKGTSGFIGFDHMVKLTHAMEDCLNKARNNEIYIDESIMDLLLDGIDGIIELKNKFKAKEPISYPVGEYRNKLQEAINNLGEPVEEIKATVGDKEREVAEEKPPDKIPVAEETTVETPEVITLAKEPSIKTDDKEGKDVAKSYLGKFADKTIRVDVERLDSLMDLVGELVLGRNRLVQILNTMQIQGTDRHNLDDLVESTGSVDFLTTEIQGAVMMTRMVPIGRIFSKFPRLVRDLA
ncbi:MAG: Hpt domain-containing protein, partial [Calditrichia bacterium]|nr:Hpt domain-containing protein [Calditrichia bacterium]